MLPTAELLRVALTGLELNLSKVNAAIAEIRSELGQHSASPRAAAPAAGKRKPFSAAAKKRMAAAQKLRWAKTRGESTPAAAPKKAKRKMSAAGRARIIAATKKRWAAFHAAQKANS
jgi:hypothetical protein